eukprot:13125190-Heterocapsa_arctica.AAC.1
MPPTDAVLTSCWRPSPGATGCVSLKPASQLSALKHELEVWRTSPARRHCRSARRPPHSGRSGSP